MVSRSRGRLKRTKNKGQRTKKNVFCLASQAKDVYKKKESGGDLLSHTVTHAVPSAQRGLTSVFGMGTGVTLSLLPPKKIGEAIKNLDN